MTRTEKVGVVEAYLRGLGSRDFGNVSFASDVTYESPLTPKLVGRAAIEFLEGLFPIIKGVEVKQHVVDGEYVATIFDLETERGITAVFDCFKVEDGQLKEIRPFYDPSLLQD